MFIDIGQWQIPVENSKEHRKLWPKLLDYQRKNRSEFPYKESRFYKMFSKDASVEIWMYIDIFDSPEEFRKMEGAINNMLETVPELKATFDRLLGMMVPDSWKTTQWTEAAEFRVE
ncbi:MAG: hypothetical protein ACXAAO_01535 [Candidatus Thorarchaeota archaeon]